jgi:hypothetical protein
MTPALDSITDIQPTFQSIASLGVGLYQAGTKKDAELLYVSEPLCCLHHVVDQCHYVGNRLISSEGCNWLRVYVPSLRARAACRLCVVRQDGERLALQEERS